MHVKPSMQLEVKKKSQKVQLQNLEQQLTQETQGFCTNSKLGIKGISLVQPPPQIYGNHLPIWTYL